MLAEEIPELTAEDRKQAVCIAMTWAPGLIRFAARYTHCIDDAEDAYQRSMEIALTSAPTLDRTELRRWLHTVLRREAATIARARTNELPVSDADLDASFAKRQLTGPEPQALVEWRERYRALQSGFQDLTESQQVCLMFRSAGASHAEIIAVTGYSERKVLRSITEGRARLQAWEVRVATGAECARVGPLIDDGLGGATRRERRLVTRHVRHCQGCRARFRAQRDQLQLLGSMVPGVLLGSDVLTANPPDPGFAVSWWERVSASAGARSAQAMQLMMDIPALATSKAGAGAIAAAAAGAIGAPVVVDAVRHEPPRRPAIAQVKAVEQRVAPVATRTPARSSAPAATPRRPVATRSTPSPKRTTTSGPTPSRTTRRPTPPPRPSTNRAPSKNSAALEFGP